MAMSMDTDILIITEIVSPDAVGNTASSSSYVCVCYPFGALLW